MWDRDTPAISVGLRGLVGEEIDDHRRRPRPAFRHVRRCRRQSDPHPGEDPRRACTTQTGRVTIPGFYDGVEETPSQIKEAWETLGETAESFLGEIGLSIPAGEKGRSVLELIWARPTAEVNGI